MLLSIEKLLYLRRLKMGIYKIDMRKIVLILATILLISFSLSAKNSNDNNPVNDKITLSEMSVLNSEIQLVVHSVNNYILSKKDGWQWPVSKIVFSKKNGEMLVDITGIDNSWAKLFVPGEESIGYFVLDNRLFVVSLNGVDRTEVDAYFMLNQSNKERVFSVPDGTMKPVTKTSPAWNYKFVEGTMIVTGYEGI